ncbi:MAG: PilN domain-containing protein [Deltaproteobacteria bacterium]
MYGRFVGLDIGKRDVKASLIKRGLRDIQLLQTIRIEKSVITESQPHYLSNIFTEYSLPKGDIAVSLSEDPTSVRVIKLPFSDSKKIDQVYGFELENISTFDPGEKIHGYHLVKNDTGSEALVCVFEKEDVGQLLEVFNSDGIDPKVVTYTPVAFGALNELLEGARPLVLVDIGDDELSFTLFDETGMKRVRSSRKPMQLFMENLCSLFGISRDEFGFSKEEFSRLSGEDLKESFRPVLSEIKKTVHFFETELKEEIRTILVSGSLSQPAGLCDLLKNEFGRDVKKLFIPDLGVDNSPVYAKSYALALYGSSLKGGYLNFRKDDFKYAGMDHELRKVFMAPAVLLAVLILLFIYNNASRYLELKKEVNILETQISEVVKETFPDVKVIPRPVEYMESKVSELREKLNMIEGVQGASTPLEVLRNISTMLPESMKVTLNDVRFENGNNVKIQGVCDSYQEVTEIEEALSKSEIFETVTRNQTGNTVNGKTKFEISLVLKPQV